MSSAILRLTAFCCVVAAVTAFRSLIPRKQMKSFNMGPGEVDGVPQDGGSLSRSDIAKFAFPVASFAAVVVPFLQSKNVFAADEIVATEQKVVLGPPPVDFGLEYKDYYADSAKVVNHMRYAVQMEKGNPRLAEVAQKTKDETLDYVSYYRRFTGISGKQSFSLLYTSINVLSGHYTSYGVKFPVPEKRRKRLLQEFNDIEKNIRKKR